MEVSNFLQRKNLVNKHVDSGDHMTVSCKGHNNIHILKNGGKERL